MTPYAPGNADAKQKILNPGFGDVPRCALLREPGRADPNTDPGGSLGLCGDVFRTVPVRTLLTGLLPATKYYFRLRAENTMGSSRSEILSFTTSAPH
jgi:hypothetical protein